ncbi:MAG: imidazole glycerol phosphate synthase subunit HisF [Alphaproteobacteria bacterium]|nr:imidazole glycerol phosphate synthase subunit HisF [Alphaproteobacteria bacterium]|tara:strand:- start:14715 stop:15500 length:786 start_codon:yes stop_codon:yes gene_type:complete
MVEQKDRHNVRLIARLDIKGPNLIKAINLEGIRVIGDPNEHARRYYEQGADELIYMDMVASLYGRNNLHDIVKATSNNIFVPITVGGGVRSVDDAEALLFAGADKVAVNTAATQNPTLITDISRRFGAQCMVLSIEAKKMPDGQWRVYVDCGREDTGMDAIAWAKQGVANGAGEILLTSIDHEGTRKGFDTELTKLIAAEVPVPVIASGGFGKTQDIVDVVSNADADGVAIADALHYGRMTLPEIRNEAIQQNIPMRSIIA